MGKFEGVKLTNKGLRLQAKLQTGAKLVIKGVVVGNGYLADNTNILSMTELISPINDAKTDIIGNEVTGNGYSRLEARITSGDTAFYLREIGIIATDPDEGDILYAYTNAGDYADFIPAATDNITTQDIILITAIGNADDVKINITLDAEVRREEFNEHTSNASNPHSVTKLQVGLGNVDNVKQASKMEFDSHTSDENNPHSVTKSQVGLGNVINEKQATKAEFDNLCKTVGNYSEIIPSFGYGNIVNTINQIGDDIYTKIDANKETTSNHISNKNNPHSVTKSQVGLSNVENKSSAAIRSELTKANVTDALGYTPPREDTHYTSKNVIGNLTDADNATSIVANGNVYLKHIENGTATSTHQITGTGATAVTTDTNANIIINSTDRSAYTLIFAASNSTSNDKAKADIVLSGSDDRAEIMNAINALPSEGGASLYFCAGTYNLKINSIWSRVSWGGSGKYIGIYTGTSSNVTKISGAGSKTIFNISSAVTDQPIYGIYTESNTIVENLQLTSNALTGNNTVCLLRLFQFCAAKGVFFNASYASNVVRYFSIGASSIITDSFNLSADDTNCHANNLVNSVLDWNCCIHNFTSGYLPTKITLNGNHIRVVNCRNIQVDIPSGKNYNIVSNNVECTVNNLSSTSIVNNNSQN